MTIANYRRRVGETLARATMFWLLALAVAAGSAGEASAQWTTSGTTTTTSGNVGIGTTAPEQTLHVHGNEILSTGAGAGFKFRDRNSSSAADDWVWYAQGNVAHFWRAGKNLLSVTPSGNIGIGTNTTNEKLGVQGMLGIYTKAWASPTGRGLFMYHGGEGVGGSIYSFNYPAGVSDPLTFGGSHIDFGTYVGGTFTKRVTIDNAGNLGIGTTSPASKLFVGSGTPAVQTLAGINVALGGSSYVAASNGTINTFIGSDMSSYGIVGTLTNHPLGLRANNTLAVTVMPNGNVGVGTTAPAAKLDVAGNVNGAGLCIAGDCKTSWSQLGGGSSQWTTSGSSLLYNAGNVGLGTTAPTQRLDVQGNTRMVGPAGSWVLGSAHHLFVSDDGVPVAFQNRSPIAGSGAHMFDHGGVFRGLVQWNNPGAINGNAFNLGTAGADPIVFVTNTDQVRMAIAGSGNVGIGTTSPATALHVVGNITVDGNINAKYQDVAEWVPSAQKLAAGTVVVLDTGRDNHVLASHTAYDTRVAGVISAQPGLSLGEAGEGKVLVATTGRVKVRVDATRAPIKIGDLIVTSDVAGVAMRSEPVSVGGVAMHRPGTLIGKALEPLAGGTGEILVLLSLQ